MQINRKSILFIALIVCVFTTGNIFSENKNQLITELIITNNDSVFRYLYLYDTNGNKVVETKFIKNNDSWARNSQIEWLYENNNCTTQRESNWKNNNWETNYLIEYLVDGNLKTEVHSIYKDKNPTYTRKIESEYSTIGLSQKKEFERVNSSWEQILQSIYVYNSDSSVDSVFTLVYNTGNVEESYLNLYFYYPHGKLANQVLKKKMSTDVWINSDSISYFYLTGTDSLISQRNKIWNNNTHKWENDQKIDYLYDDSHQLIYETCQRWNAMFWENEVRYEYQYEGLSKRTRKTLSLPIYEKWRKIHSINYLEFVEDKAQMIESKHEFWGGPTGEFKTSFIPFEFNNEPTIRKAEKISISYLPIKDSISSVNFVEMMREFPVYPNPTTGVCYVNQELYDVLSWVVTDLSGKVVMIQNQLKQSGIIDITELRKGIYILKLNTAKRQIIQKLVKK